MNRYDRLDVEDFLCAFVGPDVKVGVALERHADQVADRVLQLLGKIGGALAGRSARAGIIRSCIGLRRQANRRSYPARLLLRLRRIKSHQTSCHQSYPHRFSDSCHRGHPPGLLDV
jgi:hypothetical protein